MFVRFSLPAIKCIRSKEIGTPRWRLLQGAGKNLRSSELRPPPSLSWPSPPYRPNDPDQQARSDKAGNQVAQPSPKDDPKHAQNSAGNRRPNDAKQNIHQQAHVTFHELLCQPPCNPDNDDSCDPAHSTVHGSPPGKDTPCPGIL